MIVRTVVIAVTVTVTTMAAFGSIQNHGKILETLFTINIFQFGKHGAFSKPARTTKRVRSVTFSIICVSATMSMGGQSTKI